MPSQACQTITPQDPSWNMNTGASSHLADNTGILTSFSNSIIYPSVIVDNGNFIPVTHTGHSFLQTPYKPLHLNRILVTPHIIKNLMSIRKFTRDNDVSVEFDAYGFSVKDYQTQKILLRCDSTGYLYPVTQQHELQTPVVLLSFSSTTWHRRLGHPGDDVLRRLESTNVNVVRSMWLFEHKFHAYGSLSRYKARLVANGRSQQQGIDCDETFSPVVKPATIRTILSLAVTRDWPIHQLDVNNAFLHGQLSEAIYMHQPPGFVDSTHPDYVCHLQRSFKIGASLFVYHRGSDIAYLLLYVDDIVLTTLSTALLQRIITLLHSEFAMTDLGPLNYFLGISAQRSKSGLFLSQLKFAEEILERAHMQHCNPCKTPVDTESKLGSDGDIVSDPTLYRSLTDALQYLTFTRPAISYVVHQICLYMHDPRDPRFTALKRILRYVHGTLDHGLQLHVSSASQLTAFTDADWVGCPVTRRSTSGYCVFLSDNLLSWSAKRHVTLSRSSVEVEYRGVANVVSETAWIRNLLLELHAPLTTATLVYCDNPAHGSSPHATPAYSSSQPSSLPARGSSQQGTHDQIFQPAFAPYNTFAQYGVTSISVSRPTCPARKSTGGPFYTLGNYAYVPNVFQSQTTMPSQACQTITPQDPSWNMNTGASFHLADNTDILTSFSNSIIYPSVIVDNGNFIPVTHTGHSFLQTPYKPLHLNRILVTPHIIKNLIYVRKFTRDNDVSVEFDAYGFSVKDYQTQKILLCCDSTGDLYPITQQHELQTPVVLLSFSSTTWHRRLGHPGDDVLRRLESNNLISCNKSKLPALCHACQLGKHVKLSFHSSQSSVKSVFEIIHSNIWTSSISSESKIKYYAIFLDHFSYFFWVYHLHKKSDLFDNFVAFRAYVNKQFNVDIKALQCDRGGEYDNTRFHDLFRQNGIQFRFSCPRTS
nr:ribonuclease H-like domain-containing protein [Tanacetum cinerariifolium]